jgi:cell division protein FtsA
MAIGRNGVLVALDVGTTKVSAFVARADENGLLRVVGIGHQVSVGMRSGAVADMDALERAIRATVDAAERMAGEIVSNVLVNLSAGRPSSQTVGVDIAVAGRAVGDDDVRRVLEQGSAQAEPGSREVLHAVPIGYSIDGARGIRDPRGMFATRLGVDIHVVTVSAAPVRNLVACVERCHLNVTAMVASAYAAGLGVLVEDEKDLGVTLIDMGGGTTSMAIFYDGNLVFADAVPIGGAHVTNDVARGLSTPTEHAERMKTLYGSSLPSSADEREMIRVPLVGEVDSEASAAVPRSALVRIIQPRLEETFELVRERLEASGMVQLAGRRVVLTGGACQLQGVRELAARMLDKQVRIGRPLRLRGLADSTAGPAFAVCSGLLHYAASGETDVATTKQWEEKAPRRRLTRMGEWLQSYL